MPLQRKISNWMMQVFGTSFSHSVKYTKNTFYVSLSTIIESAISYLIIILISRYLGAEGLGQYSFLFSFVALFFLVTDFGLSTLLVNDISKNKKLVSRYVSNIFSFNIITGLISLLVYVIIALFALDANVLILGIIVGFAQLFTVFRLLPLGVLRVFQKGKAILAVNVIERLLALSGAIISIVIYHSLFWFLFSLFVASLIRLLLIYSFAKKHFTMSFSLNWAFIWPAVRKAFPFLLIAAFTYIYVQLDTVMLSFMKDDLVVGWYNASYKIINILSLIPTILLTFGFPLFSRYYHNNKKQLKIMFEKIIQISVTLIFPIIVGVFLVGDRVLEFIYQFTATESFIAFKILIIAELFIFLTFIMGNLISAADNQRVFAKIAGLGALFNILLNFILIPRFSLYGAAFSTLLTYFLMFLFMYFYIMKKITRFSLFKGWLVIILATGAMGGVILLVLHWWLPLILLLSVVVYFLLLLLLPWIGGLMQSALRVLLRRDS